MKFFDIRDYIGELRGINIVIGGRGIGKTYSVLNFLYENNEKFIYLRNTDVQLDEACGDFGNPFKRLNMDKGRNVYVAKEKKHALIIEDGNCLGYAAALSTFENLRSVDLSDVKWVIFEEFIEKKKLKFDQFTSFVNFYETVNRNRELFGEEPLKCILLSNSQSLNNPILAGYDLIGTIENMISNRQQKFKKENLTLLLPESEISELKKETGNYKLIKGTKIYKEAIENKFASDSFYGVKKRPISEYICLCSVDDIYIYKHKSSGNFYACDIQATNIMEYNSKDNRIIFLRNIGRYLMLAAASGNLEYSSFTVKAKLSDILK